jgi:NAD(P)-dependent dehydrogenase (short-subunit alcohol dehydrogenase family)
MNHGETWTGNDIGDLAGHTAVVTGASSGIGLETARRLAMHGAGVVLACRDQDRGRQAAELITGTGGRADVRAEVVDLANLASVRRFAEGVLRRHDGVDILVNNAGIAGGPHRRTVDGFEAHLGTNHLGHFALAGLLLPALLARPGARVVTVTSSVAAQGRIDFADLNSERRYRFVAAYSRSKLANLMFAIELDRRAKEAAVPLISIAANPGIVATALLRSQRGRWGRGPRPAELAVATIQRLFGQPPGDGCLTSLYAATAPGLRGGEYIVPNGPGHRRGDPVPALPPRRALDAQTARQLWAASTDLTGVDFGALTSPGDRDRVLSLVHDVVDLVLAIRLLLLSSQSRRNPRPGACLHPWHKKRGAGPPAGSRTAAGRRREELATSIQPGKQRHRRQAAAGGSLGTRRLRGHKPPA